MNPLLITTTLILGVFCFGIIFMRRILAIASLNSENRFDQFALRLKSMWRLGFKQEKLISRKRERKSGIMHAIIFWGFLVLMIRTMTLVGEGFSSGFHLPFLGPQYLSGFIYILIKDVVEGLVFFAVLYALYRRHILKVGRLYNTWHAYFILYMELFLVLSDILFEVARFKLIQMGNPTNLTLFYNEVWGNEWSYTPFANLFSFVLLPFDSINTLNILMQVFYSTHIIAVISFLCYLPINKHFHVITALPNSFFAALGYPHMKMPHIDLEDEKAWEDESIGMNHLHQMTWKQGLDLYTCTECGRCQEVCPTWVTNKPLDLKTFNDSLKKSLYESNTQFVKRFFLKIKLKKVKDETQKKQIEEQLQKLANPKSLIGDIIQQDTLWACTTCRACEEVCPVSIEHVPRILSMRMGQTLMFDTYPQELSNAFKGLERNSNPWGIGFDTRADWAQSEGMELKIVGDQLETEFLLWVGCAGSFDKRAQSVAKATAGIFKKAGIEFSILGAKEKCTGDLARRSGNEMLFQQMAMENIETMDQSGIKKIITFCPHCLNSLKNEYPAFGGHYEVYHHTEIIQKLLEEGKITPTKKNDTKITYHDPCYLGRYNKVYDEPREILNQVSEENMAEMKYSRNESFCCGAGGARMWMEEKIGEPINHERLNQADETGAETLAVGCPFCLSMLETGMSSKETKNIKKIKDVSEIVYESL